ncbi:MAG TPA: response regulator receiver protein, partial [Deltaproteobacteria bacterium]|nr:response regulator receiver protein [Desulfobacterales bacterium]HDM78539.1 response regulator receiver protein [Deltaproteobacteria bacterium]
SRGEKAQAIRIYERCKDALRRGLDTEPSQTTVAIYRRIAG